MCKELPVISVKGWWTQKEKSEKGMAELEERHKGSLTKKTHHISWRASISQPIAPEAHS
jgi:hypothetical protein